WTRYGGQETATADPTINFPVLYGETLTVTTVSLQWKSYRCSGPSNQSLQIEGEMLKSLENAKPGVAFCDVKGSSYQGDFVFATTP
ncbi:hypothetical protein HAX54_036264, partial [Datura stramonium]|nr:hypothetical protein [Datura stramonium]